MKPPRITLVLCLVVPSTLMAVGVACSSKEEKPKTAAKPRADAAPGGNGGSSQGEPGAKPEKEKRIKTQAQALKVLQVTHAGQIAEGKAARSRSTDPRVQALAEAVISGHTRASERLQAIAKKAGITPQSSSMTDFMEFRSRGSVNHIENLFPALRDSAYASRVIEVETDLLKAIEEELTPVVEDEDLTGELGQVQNEATAHVDTAQQVKNQLDAKATEDAGLVLPDSGAGDSGILGDGGAPPEDSGAEEPVDAGAPEEEPPEEVEDAGPPRDEPAG